LLPPEKDTCEGHTLPRYEGRLVTVKAIEARLGRKVVFIATEPEKSEWPPLWRAAFADGSYFTSGKTYLQLLESFTERMSEMERDALAEELNEASSWRLPATKAEMSAFISGHAAAPEPIRQFAFEF
jgi:hypothetical protein